MAFNIKTSSCLHFQSRLTRHFVTVLSFPTVLICPFLTQTHWAPYSVVIG